MAYQLDQDGRITGSNSRTLVLSLNQKAQTLAISIDPSRPGDVVLISSIELQELIDALNTVQGSGFQSLPSGK